MAYFSANCPRCGTVQSSFEVKARAGRFEQIGLHRSEVFAECRHCKFPAVFLFVAKHDSYASTVSKDEYFTASRDLEELMANAGPVLLLGADRAKPPELIPGQLQKIFGEASRCMTVKCWNASGAMFRLCLERAVKSLPRPENVPAPIDRVSNSLGLLLKWAFDNKVLPEALRSLAVCIKEDGNDGAHLGSLTEQDVLDLADFTYHLLESMFSVPARLARAEQNRLARRAQPGTTKI